MTFEFPSETTDSKSWQEETSSSDKKDKKDIKKCFVGKFFERKVAKEKSLKLKKENLPPSDTSKETKKRNFFFRQS